MTQKSDRTPTRKHAVALRYEEGDRAPRILASGAGVLAERILALAREHHIPIREDDSLTAILSRLEVGVEIPSETYRAVAEILAFLFRTDRAWRKKKQRENKYFSQNAEKLPK